MTKPRHFRKTGKDVWSICLAGIPKVLRGSASILMISPLRNMLRVERRTLFLLANLLLEESCRTIACWHCSNKLPFPRKHAGEFVPMSIGTLPQQKLWKELLQPRNDLCLDGFEFRIADELGIEHFARLPQAARRFGFRTRGIRTGVARRCAADLHTT